MYVSGVDITKAFPQIKRDKAKKIIRDCQDRMREDGLYVPETKVLLALKEYVEKYLGVKF